MVHLKDNIYNVFRVCLHVMYIYALRLQSIKDKWRFTRIYPTHRFQELTRSVWTKLKETDETNIEVCVCAKRIYSLCK